MNYSIETVNGCTKKFVFNIEDLNLDSEIETSLIEKQKTSSIKGFRKGKAPLSLIKQIYGPQVEADALNRFVHKSFVSAVESENIRVIGYPTFSNTNYEAGKKISFDATIETFPEFELQDYSKLKFTEDKVEVTEEDIQEVQKNYLSSKAEMREVKEGALQNGHTAVLNFQGVKADGERPENMKGSDFLLEIGSGQFIPGFEEGLVGMKAGEKKNLDLNFPEDYHSEDLKGAKVTFETELLEIKEKVIPELTDELAKEFQFESAADMNEKTKDQLVSQKTRAAQEKLHQEILEKLIEETPFDLPNSLIEEQKKHVRDDLKNNLKSQGFNDAMMEQYFSKWDEDLVKKAVFQVRSGLILDRLSKKYEIEASEKDFEEKIMEMTKDAGEKKDELLKFYRENENLKRNLMYALSEEKTFEALKNELKIS